MNVVRFGFDSCCKVSSKVLVFRAMMKKESDTNSVTVPPAPRTYLDSQRALILQALRALRATRWVVGGPHGAAVPAGTEADYFS
jgi:hypothetical protein